jgi:hypothetical protein
MQFGDRLKNGLGSVVAFYGGKLGGVVLAKLDEGYSKYATWWIDTEDLTVTGHYHQDLKEANIDFDERVGKFRRAGG